MYGELIPWVPFELRSSLFEVLLSVIFGKKDLVWLHFIGNKIKLIRTVCYSLDERIMVSFFLHIFSFEHVLYNITTRSFRLLVSSAKQIFLYLSSHLFLIEIPYIIFLWIFGATWCNSCTWFFEEFVIERLDLFLLLEAWISFFFFFN